MIEELSPDTLALERFIQLVASKWTLLILRELYSSENGTRRFGELRRRLPAISAKTLTERLRALEEQGIVSRTVYSEVPLHVEYCLTEHGQRLQGVFKAVKTWVRAEGSAPTQDQPWQTSMERKRA